ncbi:MAG: LPS export ABC transporter periplasmic protein LptC [Rhizobiaceae bacterium]|nr:MAG: LPS export ABC transporter periplasmic protein LptC [Rhizobiaceae bacterium]
MFVRHDSRAYMAIAEQELPKRQEKSRSSEDGSKGGLADAVRRARRHSVLVRALKFLLPAAAILIALFFFAYSYVFTPAQISVDLFNTGFKDGKLIMADPKLEGFTRNNRPYRVHAAQAIQSMSDPDRIELKKITGRLPISDGNWADVTADEGFYNRDKNTLDIKSKMIVTTTNGMTAKLASAFVEMKNGTMKTPDPVDITMNTTHITAGSMDIEDRGNVLVFNRNVKLVMIPQGKKTAGGGTNENE